MHSLLARQIRKHLPASFKEHPELKAFFGAVEESYRDFDDKVAMIQRATAISSKELYEANKELESEARRQKKIIDSLEKALESLNENLNTDNGPTDGTLDVEKLAKRIGEQAEQLSQMTSEQNKLMQELETRNESLKNYAHIVSHDLKSPIRNISTLMTWILEAENEKFSEESKAHGHLIGQNLEKMDRLIDGILKHATVSSLEEEKANISIYDLLKEIEDTIFIPDHIRIDYSDNLPVIFGQKYNLEQLFTNLITNAITATEHRKKGLIEISYKPCPEYYRFSISDNGKGIPEQYQSKIFDMFNRLDNDSNATGIGLSLIKKIINLYEGDIDLESTVDQGTTFYFTLKKVS
ncbi:sensor histidine kinase [Pseudozobellia thermophila]|uniref:histidine kinase n=1 Tax=Pseudozobellia thermophila TaxID=192903 RepID=A0A1M6I2R9_9FLAO|nr:HAMP domain-containing sensor histidine kinase [Pseudozobellia thermophila]SHJ28690.1 Histidine kinase-, DNA gyrase B-, and HSP90-like ATPase [Pseudozobellia thermophila]